MADGTSFEIDIGVQSQGVEPAAAQLATLGERLTAASAASTAAAQAVKAAEASYRSAEAGADRMAKAVEGISVKATAQRAALAKAVEDGGIFSAPAQRAAAALEKMEKAQAQAAAKSAQARATLAQEAAALDKLKASAAATAAEEQKLAAAHTKAKDAVKSAEEAQAKAAGTGSARKIAAGLDKLGGPLGTTGAKVFKVKEAFDKLGGALGSAGPYVAIAVAITAIAVGMAALAVAAAAAIVKVTAWAVSLADAARSQNLLLAGFVQSTKGGEALGNAIGRLSNQIPLTNEELTSMAEQLAKTGLRGKDLENQIEANAVAAAKAKFGPDWQKQMISLDVSARRLKSNVSGLFSGLKIEKLLEQLATLVNLFSENDAAGRAIKVVFESIFQPLIDGAVAFIPKARAAFLQFEILVLKALIAIKPWGSKILYVTLAFGALGAILLGVIALAIGVVIFSMTVLAFAIAVVVAAAVALVAGLIWLGLQFVKLGAWVGQGVLAAWNWVVQTFNAVVAYLQGLSLSQIGADMINGLVAGIKAAGGAVLSAITGVVGGAIDAAKKKLGIASPSKVFAEIGMNTGEGMQQGVEKSTGDVHDAIGDLAKPPLETVGAAKAAPVTAASSSGGGGANLQGATFNFYGVEGAEDAEDRIRALMTQILEGGAAQLGARVPG